MTDPATIALAGFGGAALKHLSSMFTSHLTAKRDERLELRQRITVLEEREEKRDARREELSRLIETLQNRCQECEIGRAQQAAKHEELSARFDDLAMRFEAAQTELLSYRARSKKEAA